MRSGLIYRIWALVLGLYLGDVIKGLLLVLGPLLLIMRLGLGRLGLRAYFLNPISFKEMNYESSDPLCGRGT